MPKRAWSIPAENELPEGWLPDSGDPVVELDVADFPSEEAAEEQLVRELLNAAWVLKRFGGVFSFAADREELAPDIWRTKRYLILWESYAPGRRRAPQPEPETADAELETAAA